MISCNTTHDVSGIGEIQKQSPYPELTHPEIPNWKSILKCGALLNLSLERFDMVGKTYPYGV